METPIPTRAVKYKSLNTLNCEFSRLKVTPISAYPESLEEKTGYDVLLPPV